MPSTVSIHAPQLYFNFSFLFNLTALPQGDKIQSIQIRRSHTSSLPPATASLIPQALSLINRQQFPQTWAALDWFEGLPISASIGDSVLPLTQRRSRRISQLLLARQPSITSATKELRIIGAQTKVKARPTSSTLKTPVHRAATKRSITSPMLDQAAELSYSRQDATIKQAINTLKANLAEVQTHSAQQINALANASLKPSQASQYKLPPVEVNRIADQVYNTLERKLRTEKERRGR